VYYTSVLRERHAGCTIPQSLGLRLVTRRREVCLLPVPVSLLADVPASPLLSRFTVGRCSGLLLCNSALCGGFMCRLKPVSLLGVVPAFLFRHPFHWWATPTTRFTGRQYPVPGRLFVIKWLFSDSRDVRKCSLCYFPKVLKPRSGRV